MSMSLHLITLRLALRAPYLVHGGEPGRFGLDATLIRNAEGIPMLPGTLLAGRIAETWRELRSLADTSDVGEEAFRSLVPDPENWFGREADPSGTPRASRLIVDDLLEILPRSPEKRPPTPSVRVAIDDVTGASIRGALMFAEQSHPPGEIVEFEGVWRAWLAHGEAKSLKRHLLVGLLWQSQIGAARSVGFGEVVSASVQVQPAVPSARPLKVAEASGHRKQLRLTFSAPLMVGARVRRGNVFESSDVIPGAAIKAALARMLTSQHGAVSVGACAQENCLAKHFDRLRITHAFPSRRHDRRPMRLPMSLIKAGGEILDVANCDKPALFHGAAPSFQIDWKEQDWDQASAAQGWGKTRSLLRIRTRIDRETRNADEGGLFAYQCCVPMPGTVWLCNVDLPDDLSREQLSGTWDSISRMLECGIGPIGKTDAWATAELLEDAKSVWDEAPITPDRAVLTLQTPALLFASSQVLGGERVNLHELYAKAFGELSNDRCKLKQFFASQSLAGGDYLKRRFRSKVGETYLPYVLTDPGSVFILEPGAADGAEFVSEISRWMKIGLPVSGSVVAEHGGDWERNPFVPENGYGEIAANVAHGFKLAHADI